MASSPTHKRPTPWPPWRAIGDPAQASRWSSSACMGNGRGALPRPPRCGSARSSCAPTGPRSAGHEALLPYLGPASSWKNGANTSFVHALLDEGGWRWRRWSAIRSPRWRPSPGRIRKSPARAPSTARRPGSTSAGGRSQHRRPSGSPWAPRHRPPSTPRLFVAGPLIGGVRRPGVNANRGPQSRRSGPRFLGQASEAAAGGISTAPFRPRPGRPRPPGTQIGGPRRAAGAGGPWGDALGGGTATT